MQKLIFVTLAIIGATSPALAQRWKYPPPQTRVQNSQYETITIGYSKAWEKQGAAFVEGQWQHECRYTPRISMAAEQADNGGRHLAVYEYGNGFIYVACYRQLISRRVQGFGGGGYGGVRGPIVNCTSRPDLPECRGRR